MRGELVATSVAANAIVLLSSEATAGVTGRYFRQSVEAISSRLSQDPEVGRQLWDLSVRLVGLGPGLQLTPPRQCANEV
jgi:hypothetical protein